MIKLATLKVETQLKENLAAMQVENLSTRVQQRTNLLTKELAVKVQIKLLQERVKVQPERAVPQIKVLANL